MEDKTHWKIKRSIGGRNKFPIPLHPTGSSTGEHRWTGGFHPDNITVFHRNPDSDFPSDVHLQCRGRVGRTRTSHQDVAAWVAIPSAICGAVGTAFDGARSAVRIRMSRTS